MQDRRGDFDLIEAGISDVQSALVRGDLTARDLTAAYLRRIETYDESLNSVITVNEMALSRAESLDDDFATKGIAGPLHGIPFLVKDNIDVAGLPTTAGSPVLERLIPKSDATVVQRLRHAGGIVLAKTNLGEFAREAESTLGGHVRNPYALDRTPNGSSAGTGAAVAANLGIVGLGSDTGGSVRNPAASTSLVGLRPTVGCLSRAGVLPVSPTLDTVGPMGRTVRDVAVVLDVLTGYDPDDSSTARTGEGRETRAYSSGLDAIDVSDLQLGAVRALFETDADVGSGGTQEVGQVVDEALAALRSGGASILDDVSLPFEYDDVKDDVGTVARFEFERAINRYLETVATDLPVRSLKEIAAVSEYPNELVRNRVEGGIEIDRTDPEERLRYFSTLHRRTELRTEVLTVMAANDLDALVYPTHAHPPVEIGETQLGKNTRLSPVVDLPALSVPAGFTPDHGLPVGLEFLGRPFGERTLLAIGHQFERLTRYRRPPAGFGPTSE